MTSLPSGAALTRGLLVLARAGRSGVLTVATERETARVGVKRGRVVAMNIDPDDSDPIGDVLRRMGAWNKRVADASEPPLPSERLGAWAVRVGASDAAAVSHALRKQLQGRIVRMFGTDPPELRLQEGPIDPDMLELAEPPTTAELIVGALRDRVSDVPMFQVRRALGDGFWVLSPLGQELIADATLWPDEAAIIALLKTGAPVDALLSACRHSSRAQRMLFALHTIRACGRPETRRGYSVLLRKTRQVRRAARSAELLDLPARSSSMQARKALRRLARSVHPDRFGDDAPFAIRDASRRVMSALTRAQHDLG